MLPRNAFNALSLLIVTSWLLAGTPVAAWAVNSFLAGSDPGGQFGGDVSCAGDVNGDGIADWIVGAPRDDTAGTEAGRAFLWYGGSSIERAPDVTFSNGTGFDHFGHSVSGIGDVNDDGFVDVAVGAPLDDTTGAEAGAVFVYFGGTNMNSVVDRTLLGEQGGDNFGWAISCGVDLNGDLNDIDDFVVGAPGADTPSADAGAVYLFVGSAAFSTTFARRYDGAIAGDNFGWDVECVADFRGIGVPSFLVGAPGFGLDAGRAYLYEGAVATLPDTVADVVFTNTIGDVEFGYAVASTGQFNADGLTDVVVGGPGRLGNRGYVRVYFGKAVPDAQPTADLEIVGELAGDRFGAALAHAGNALGSDRSDLLVGAPMRNAGAAMSGQAYLFAGGSSYTAASQGQDILPENPSSSVADDLFGTAVSSLGGDVDGDGFDELIIGAPGANAFDASVSGVAMLVGSDTGIVAVNEIPFRARPTGTYWELSFGGIVARATDAQLVTVEPSPRELAILGGRLELIHGELVASIPAGELQGVHEVDLRTVIDGRARVDRFAVVVPELLLQLHRPSPNPFNPATRLRFDLARSGSVRLDVVDLRGRVVRTLVQDEREAGTHELVFDGRDAAGVHLASGVYRAVLSADGFRQSVSLILLK